MSELQDNVALAFRQWNEQREQIAALEAHNQQLREALTNLLAVARSLDAYECYGAVRRQASDTLAATEPKP